MCDVLWCWTDEAGMATLWAAVITAIPASLAIWFAYRVGKRQLAIAEKQNEVARAAHDLENERVRAENYEGRSAIFGAARKYVNTILMTNRVPGMHPASQELDAQIHREFQEALGAAEFLFDQKVANLMDAIYQTAVSYHLDANLLEPEKGIMEEIRIRQSAAGNLRGTLAELKEAVRPYLTINGRGEVPEDRQ